jgi:tetratricopeptide (TPR) repeat protein
VAERLAEIGANLAIQARALTWRAVYHDNMGRYESARESLRTSHSLLDEGAQIGVDVRRERAFALRQQGEVTTRSAEYARARTLFEDSLALYRELGDRWGTAMALVGLGHIAWNLAAFFEAEASHREALALRRELGDQRAIANSLYDLSLVLGDLGQFEEAVRSAREAVATGRETGDRILLAWGLMAQGAALTPAGRYREAYAALEESAAISEELGTPGWKAAALYLLGNVQTHLGRYRDARVGLQSSLRLAREIGYSLAIRQGLLFLGFLSLAEGVHAEARGYFQEFFAVAQTSDLRRYIGKDVAGLGLGLAEWGEGKLDQVRARFSAELLSAVAHRSSWWRFYVVPAIALLLADEGQAERAVELYGLACHYPHVGNSQWFEDVVGVHIAAVADTLPPEVVTAAQERGRARDLDATMEELLEELGG